MRALVLAIVVAAVIVAPARDEGRPNIVFIMSDDHAAHAIGAYGSRVNQTPNLDRLAREGMILTSVFATNSICTPSRAAILTGQYSHVNGVTMFNRFDSSRMTVPRLLEAGGYYTGMIGKWHLGSDPVGFDRWEILPGQGAYVNPILYTATGEKTYTGRYVTDVITDLAIDFVKNRPRNRPFFLMMHHKAPHRPWEPDAAHGARFTDRWIPEPETFWDSYDTRTDALHENQQRVAADLTRRDLKLQPPASLEGTALTAWLATKPDTVTTTRDGKEVTLTGEALTRWKYQRLIYRYYHDPGDHNTRAHYGVRTRSHKLIYFWKKDQWELFDLLNDPFELHNLYGQPGQEKVTATLKTELLRLKQTVRDDDQLASEQLPNGVDGTVASLRGK
jgi:arylsulfatase A-like enzyme